MYGKHPTFSIKGISKIIHDQLYKYTENFLNQVVDEFCKAHSTQHPLLRLLQKRQKSLTQGGLLAQF